MRDHSSESEIESVSCPAMTKLGEKDPRSVLSVSLWICDPVVPSA